MAVYSYSQSTGALTRDGVLVGTGYSGHGEGRNSPAQENLHGIGPIPRGFYTMRLAPPHPNLGSPVLQFTPDAANDMFGRSGFLMHGDDEAHDASLGCVIMAHDVRLSVLTSGDRYLEVTE